ncbi:hypothetical protein HRG84_13200 [Flavisolibacter sp. BT320]|nr:hypothetical protein [Flavisolibacter longurius]
MTKPNTTKTHRIFISGTRQDMPGACPYGKAAAILLFHFLPRGRLFFNSPPVPNDQYRKQGEKHGVLFAF